MTFKPSQTTQRRRSTVQARPNRQRSLMNYVRNGKIPAFLLLIGASWLLYATLTSPRYVVQQVVLEGGNALTQADVEALAGVQGQTVWELQEQEIEERVRQSPYVEHAHARVLLPATVVVAVRERQPAMRWYHHGATYEVAQDGRVLAAVAASPEPELSEVTEALTDTETITGTDALTATNVLTETETLTGTETLTETAEASPVEAVDQTPRFEAGGTITIVDTTDERSIQPGDYVDPDALEVARRVALRAAELPQPIDQILWKQHTGVVLKVGAYTIVIGDSERLDEKMAILGRMLREETAFSFLDLRPSAPYFHP